MANCRAQSIASLTPKLRTKSAHRKGLLFSPVRGSRNLVARLGWYAAQTGQDKAAIVVGSKEKLPAEIDALVLAVRVVELDKVFS